VTAAGAQTVPAPTRWRVLVPFALVTLIWGSTWIVIRDQLSVVPPGWSIAYRFALASAALFFWSAATGKSLKVERAYLPFVAAVGVFQFVMNFHFVYAAEHHVTSGLVAVVFALLLVPNAIMARAFLGQRLSRPFLIGSTMAISGIGLLFAHELGEAGEGAGQVAIGIALTMAGVLSASAANVMQATERARRIPPSTLLAWAMGTGAAVNVVLASMLHGAPVFEPRWGYLAGLLYLALAASALAFVLYYGLLRQLGPARAAYSSVLVPVIAMALSTLFEGYRWTPTAAAGCALALGGLLVALARR